MKKRIIGLVLIFEVFALTPAFSQATIDYEKENKLAQKYTQMYVSSANVQLPDSVYTILREFANRNTYPVAAVFKQDLLIKVIYNEAFSKEDRLLFCDKLIYENTRPGRYIPVYLITSMKAKLLSSK